MNHKYHIGEWVGSAIGLLLGWTIALEVGDIGYGLWGRFLALLIGIVAGMTIGWVIAARFPGRRAAE